MRVYPRTAVAEMIAAEGPMETNPAIRRKYDGPVDLFRPTFYISAELGDRPAGFGREPIAGDPRFFEPMEEEGDKGHNYNDNRPLVEAIRGGARGAYWDILRRRREERPERVLSTREDSMAD